MCPVFQRRRRIYTRFFKVPVKVDPLVVIKNRLIYLGTIRIENESDSKKIYFEITELLKQYIAYQYHVSVAGLTDYELLQWAHHNLSEAQLDILKQLYSHVSEIKFEHQAATAEQVKKSIELMQEFITIKVISH